MSRLSPFLSRALALLLLVAAVTALYGIVVGPLLDSYVRSRSDIEEYQALLARLHVVGAAVPDLESEVSRLRSDRSSGTGYLPSGSDSLIAARLQERVKQVVTRHGATLKTTQTLPVVAKEALRQVAIRVEMTANIEALKRILFTLESGRPYLLADNLDIRTGRSPRPDDSAEAEIPLTVRFDVLGFLRAEGRES